MTTPAAALVADARRHLGDGHGPNDCARYVSAEFAATGHGDVFGSSAWVPVIVGRFKAADRSCNLADAQLGDLVVFGLAEHVAIYSGAGKCIGTLTDKNGSTTVREVPVSIIQTGTHRGFSTVLRTHLGQTEPSPTPPPAPAPTPPATPPAGVAHTYRVVSGDNLTKIARTFGTSWGAIYAANRSKIGPRPDVLRVGLVLTIPA